MSNGAKAFALAALMAVVAISGSQGQARQTQANSLPSAEQPAQ